MLMHPKSHRQTVKAAATRHGAGIGCAAITAVLILPLLLLAPLAAAQSPQASSSPAASSADSEASTRRLLSLVDYIGGDYTEAVRQGKIVNDAEYKEMQDFAAGAQREFDKLKTKLPDAAVQEVKGNLNALALLIEQKADVSAIRALTKSVKDRVIETLAVSTAPTEHPDYKRAQELYASTCASCHGGNGQGDGAAAKGMEPPPRNFHDAEVMGVSSPFKFYNALVLGVDGTSMISYAKAFSDKDLWSLAYYVTGLRYVRPPNAATPNDLWDTLPTPRRKALADAGLSLALLGKASDDELAVWVSDRAKTPAGELAATMAVLRLAAPYLTTTPRLTAVTPTGDQEPQTAAASPRENAAEAVVPTTSEAHQHLDFVSQRLDAARQAFAQGDIETAEAQLFDAYLEGYERVEVILSLKDSSLVTTTEQDFIAARAAARARDESKFAELTARLDSHIDRARHALAPTAATSGDSWLSGAGEFVSSFVIIAREGLEAFLIVGAILALLTNVGAAHQRKWIHLGWISASIAGFVTFLAFTYVFEVSGAARETIEAVCTGLAAIVLFYVSFWLLNQTERSRWEAFLRKSASSAVTSKSRMRALFFLSFIAVYREAAETVLFYAALGSQATNPTAIVGGFVVGCIVLLGVCWAIMRFGIRLPLRKFFLTTSTVMIVISIILAGKAVNELIEAGFIAPTTIGVLPTVELLGIYPSLETIGVQLVAIALALALVYFSSRQASVSST